MTVVFPVSGGTDDTTDAGGGDTSCAYGQGTDRIFTTNALPSRVTTAVTAYNVG